MIIKGISASIPSRVVTNDDMVEMIRDQSTEFEDDLDQTLETVKKLLEKSGLKQRHWCDRHELPIDHVAKACKEALAYCKRTMQALDGDIYCESELGEHTAFRLSFPDLVVPKLA
ncbi:hypothetical protein N9H77_01120 [Porticoccaceae bacterium]|nr:hypothetical protein [Porticoccaceae bacterium]